MICIIEIISTKIKALGDLINSNKLRKIPVITKSGEIIGRVKAVRMNKFSVEGIQVSRPWSFFSSTFIDKSLIKVFNQNEAVLNINPVTALKGLAVYDTSGRRLGTVRKIIREGNSNNFKSLVVKNRFYSRAILIEKDKIDIMKKNIILNIDYLEYTDSIKRQKEREKKRK